LREIAEEEVRYSHPEILNARSADVTVIDSIENSTDVTKDADTK